MSWRDLSSPAVQLEQLSLAHVRLRRYVVFHDERDRQRLHAALSEFREQHVRCDQMCDTSWELKIEGFQDEVVVGSQPWWVGLGPWAIAVFVGLGLPLRCILWLYCARAELTILKEIFATEDVTSPCLSIAKTLQSPPQGPAPARSAFRRLPSHLE
jgi:hypothetical protein